MSLVLCCALSALPPTPVAAGVRHIETCWVDPGFGGRGIHTIVVLPAVTWDDNHDASVGPANTWLDAFSGSGYRWIPADDVVSRLGRTPSRRDSLLGSVAKQVRQSGAIDSVTAHTLGLAFGAEGILCLRVDRWEEGVGGASRPTAVVDVHGSIVDTTGTELWRIGGRSLNDGPAVDAPSLEHVANSPDHASAIPQKGWTGAAISAGPTGASGSTSTGGRSAGGSSGTMRNLSGSPGGSSSSDAAQAAAGLEANRGEPVEVSPIYRGALMKLFVDWASRLPPPARPAR